MRDMQNVDVSPNLEGMRSIADIPKLGDITRVIRLRWRYSIGMLTMDI